MQTHLYAWRQIYSSCSDFSWKHVMMLWKQCQDINYNLILWYKIYPNWLHSNIKGLIPDMMASYDATQNSWLEFQALLASVMSAKVPSLRLAILRSEFSVWHQLPWLHHSVASFWAWVHRQCWRVRSAGRRNIFELWNSSVSLISPSYSVVRCWANVVSPAPRFVCRVLWLWELNDALVEEVWQPGVFQAFHDSRTTVPKYSWKVHGYTAIFIRLILHIFSWYILIFYDLEKFLLIILYCSQFSLLSKYFLKVYNGFIARFDKDQIHRVGAGCYGLQCHSNYVACF